MLTFTRAETVEVGDDITSEQCVNLATAHNDRMRAFKMCAWRRVMYDFNLWRQVRNPAEPGYVFPSQAEAFDIYHHLDPEYIDDTTWPVAGPGEFEGANLANPMMQYVFGVSPNLEQEDIRINESFPFDLPEGATLEDIWYFGKQQRGAFDPDTGAQNTPAFSVAQDVFRISSATYSPHGKSYGGFFPSPVKLLTSCGALDSTGLDVPSYEIKFTGLRPDVSTAGLHGTLSTDVDGNPVVTYAGSCPCWTDSNDADHVLGIAQLPFAYYVYVSTAPADCEGAIDRLPLADWIAGPYTGVGVLQKADGGQLSRAMNAFNYDFRGTDEQRDPDDYNIEEIGASFQEFNMRQYALAPALGTLMGEFLVPDYPQFTFGGAFVNQGTHGSGSHHYRDGFILGGAFAKATGLVGSATIGLVNEDEEVLLSITLTAEPDHSAMAIKMISGEGETPKPLRAVLLSDARFTSSSGSIMVEACELYEYLPQWFDSALVLRVSASRGGTPDESGVDGRGRDCDFATEITDRFFTYGCIVNKFGISGVRDINEWVNDNPGYDSARRQTRDSVRVVRRQNLKDGGQFYEVGADGKAVLYFKRFAFGLHNIRADMFKDIAPPIDPVASGSLIEGETYIVRRTTGAVNYLGKNYYNDERFTATRISDFQTVGDAKVYVYDGIRHAALKKGFSNEWLMFLETKCYHPSASSIWKPDAYSDYFAWNNRCHFYSGTAPKDLRLHFNYQYGVDIDTGADFTPILNPERLQSEFIAPEAPDQYNYTHGANRTFGDASFYSSCRIYEAPYEIESCVVDDWGDDQIIKITLTSRLLSHPDAPASVNVDPAIWSADEISILRNEYVPDPTINEDYRTDDNAVREYALHQADSTKQCVFRNGDAGTFSSVSGLPDNPYGSCYPHFFFCKLIPLPYEDGNNVWEEHDARCTMDMFAQMETTQRAICEGFVDGVTSEAITCATGDGGLFEFKFENLCFQGFGGRWITAFSEDDRPDDPEGFGPLPNTLMYADVFNRLAQNVNLLDKVRLDVPIEFNYRTNHYFGQTDVSAGVVLTSTVGGCSDISPCYGYLDGGGCAFGQLTSTDAWATWTAIAAGSSCALSGCPFVIQTTTQTVEYLAEIDPAFVNVVPAAIQELVDLGHTGFLVNYAVLRESWARSTSTVANDGSPCCFVFQEPCPGKWFTPGAPTLYHKWTLVTNESTTGCKLVTSGVLNSPPVPGSDMGIGRNGDFAVGSFCTFGPGASVSYELIADQEVFIQIPLTE